MRIIRHSGINNRGIMALILEARCDLQKNGFGGDEISDHFQDKAIVCYEHLSPVGIITYNLMPDQNFLFVKLAYVMPEYRQATRYHMMMAELIAVAREEKCGKITAVIDPENDLSKQVHAARGFFKVSETWDYVIPSPIKLTPEEILHIDKFIKTKATYYGSGEDDFGF